MNNPIQIETLPQNEITMDINEEIYNIKEEPEEIIEEEYIEIKVEPQDSGDDNIQQEDLNNVKDEPDDIDYDIQEELNDIKDEPDESDTELLIPDKPDLPNHQIVPFKSLTPYLIQRYEKHYDKFDKWKTEAGYDSITEDIIAEYFTRMINQNRPAKASMISSRITILRIVMNYKHDIDIYNFEKVKFLSTQMRNNMLNRESITFSLNELEKFLKEAPDSRFLLVKAALIIGLTGLIKTVKDFCNITIKDFTIDGTSIKIRPKILKVKSTDVISRIVFAESFTILKKYMSLRPKNIKTDRFFLNYQFDRCTTTVVSRNKFAGMPKLIATYLNLPNAEDYDGSTFINTAKFLSTQSKIDANNRKSLKTKQKYQVIYDRFNKWKIEQGYDGFSEDVILKYFDEMKQQPEISSGTVVTRMTMLKTCILSKHDFDIFEFDRLKRFHEDLKVQYKSKFTPKEMKTFTLNEIEKFLREAPDFRYLLMKAVLIVGITGICSTNQEFSDLMIDDFKDNGTSMKYQVKTNKKTGNTPIPRIITGESYTILRKYMDLRPIHTEVYNLFLNYANSECSRHAVNKLRFSGMPKLIAEYLNLPNPEDYGGSVFRDTAELLLGQCDENILGMEDTPSIDPTKNIRKRRTRSQTSASVVFPAPPPPVKPKRLKKTIIKKKERVQRRATSVPMKNASEELITHDNSILQTSPSQPPINKLHQFDLDIPSSSTCNESLKPSLEVSTSDDNTIYVHLKNCPHMKVYFVRN